MVDDDEPVRKAMDLLLESVGLSGKACSSAEDFLRAYDPGRPGWPGARRPYAEHERPCVATRLAGPPPDIG